MEKMAPCLPETQLMDTGPASEESKRILCNTDGLSEAVWFLDGVNQICTQHPDPAEASVSHTMHLLGRSAQIYLWIPMYIRRHIFCPSVLMTVSVID